MNARGMKYDIRCNIIVFSVKNTAIAKPEKKVLRMKLSKILPLACPKGNKYCPLCNLEGDTYMTLSLFNN